MKVLTAFYDLKFGPVSFDFVTWLVRARMEAKVRGAEGLHVVVVPYEEGLGGFSRHWGKHDAADVQWRLMNIVVASCPLMRATFSLAYSRAHAEQLAGDIFWWPSEAVHFNQHMVDAAKRGDRIPRLKPTDAAKRYVAEYLKNNHKKVVTLTARQQSTDPDRNSSLKEWARAEEWFTSEGYFVIRIDDTRAALSRGSGYAEFSVDLRAALYEQSFMNLIGNNGPCILLRYSSSPYMQFDTAMPFDKWTKHYLIREGLSVADNEQLPWATHSQRLVYRPGTFEIIKEEFERWAGATK